MLRVRITERAGVFRAQASVDGRSLGQPLTDRNIYGLMQIVAETYPRAQIVPSSYRPFLPTKRRNAAP